MPDLSIHLRRLGLLILLVGSLAHADKTLMWLTDWYQGNLDSAEITPRVVIFRMRAVPAIDGTGLRALQIMGQKFKRRGTKLILSGVQPQPMKVLFNSGFVDKLGLDNICPDIDASLVRAWEIVGETPKPAAAPAA